MVGFAWRLSSKAAPVAAAAAAAVAAPSDSDNDGVTDDLDKCPGTPAGAKVDATGCELDSDSDGVVDSKDKCPDTKPGMQVDSVGCDLDSDGDGVTNDKDLCPDTPAGTKVNATGCSEKVGFVIRGINFATGSAALTSESLAILDRVAEKLLANPGIKITVDGHTDSTGSKALNTRLSKARAQAVADYFVSKGVSADNLSARGFGPDRPVADNKTAAGRAENRRVEIQTVN
jgi:OOP family OmpA-OmpF porin